MDDLAIRAATPDDHALFLALNADVQGMHAEHRPDLFKAPPEVRFGRADLAALLGRPGTVVWLALRGDQAVGYLYAERRDLAQDAFVRARCVLYVHQVVVRRDARGRGYGTALVRKAMAHARTCGASRVELDVWTFNAGARRLYERLGFASIVERMSLAVR